MYRNVYFYRKSHVHRVQVTTHVRTVCPISHKGAERPRSAESSGERRTHLEFFIQSNNREYKSRISYKSIIRVSVGALARGPRGAPQRFAEAAPGARRALGQGRGSLGARQAAPTRCR